VISVSVEVKLPVKHCLLHSALDAGDIVITTLCWGRWLQGASKGSDRARWRTKRDGKEQDGRGHVSGRRVGVYLLVPSAFLSPSLTLLFPVLSHLKQSNIFHNFS
jgi:hypothetical protein